MPSPSLPSLRRRALFLGAILAALLALIVLALAAGAWLFPAVAVRMAVARLEATTGQRITFASARWHGLTGFSLEGLQAADAHGTVYFAAQRATLGWKWYYLLRYGRLGLFELERPELYVAKMVAAFPSTAAPAAPQEEAGDPFELIRQRFYKIRVSKGIVWLDNIAPGFPPLPLSIGGKKPLEWTTGSVTEENGEEKLQHAETEGIRLYSPADPLVPVLDLGKLEITFTWGGLARREIATVAVTGPKIYVGPGLFAFADVVKAGGGARATSSAPAAAGAAVPPPPAPASAPAQEWTLHNFVVDRGQLVITAFGEPGVTLPFSFHASAQDLGLNHLDQLSVQSLIRIERQTYDYPSYGVKLTDLSGDIRFSLPLQDKKANNLVQTIWMEKASWKGIEVHNASASVTFDRTGIYGQIWASAYRGYVEGDYAVRFDDGFPWHAGLYVTGAEVEKPVAILAGQHFALSGKMNARVEVDAKSRDIGRAEARVTFLQGGHMEIPSVSEVEQKLPPEWDGWRRQIIGNLLSSFHTYDFDSGSLFLRYGLPVSTAELHLDGNQGKRNFVLNWRQEGASAVRLPDQRPPQVSVQLQKNP